MALAYTEQDLLQRGAVQPPKGLNYVEEQFFKYGVFKPGQLFHPQAIIGTDKVQMLNENMTPEEYNKFFNHQRPRAGAEDRKMMKRYKPKGVDYKMFGDRYHQATVLEDSERLVERSRISGITSADQIRNTFRPDLNANEGPFSNTFLSSG